MRPAILDPLFASANGLPGVGPKVETLLTKLLREGDKREPARVIDVLTHLPSGVIDRSLRPKLADAPRDTVVTLELRIDEHRAPRRGGRGPYRVVASDGTGEVQLVYFSAHRAWIEKLLPVGETRFVSGRLETFDYMLQMVHPDHVVEPDQLGALPLVEPVYPLTAGLAQRVLGRIARAALDKVTVLPEWQDRAWVARRGFPSFAEALRQMHTPETPQALLPAGPAWCRLAYDELLAGQLAIALTRARLRRARGRSLTGDGRLRRRITDALPFSLTGSQYQAIAEIQADLAAPERMLRLLQGDVGSGKTVVALMAMAIAAEAGAQSALMAPTELLARQHHKTIAPLAEAAGLAAAILTGREKGSERARIQAGLTSGEIDIIVGTHALFQADVAFRNLALAVVDEQHRFGVHQRLALTAKGESVDLLVMTATPIPRTLVLTYFGDMDSSKLTEKPAGRQKIDTRSVSLDRLSDVVGGIARAVEAGEQVYWVCPLVEESEASDLAAADERFESLKAHFGDRVGLIHGRLSGAEKDQAMAAFARGETRILVATTVIEVGVDVPEASVIVIEHAERFGLAQLHQLRGRVGRGEKASTCLLLYRGPLSATARARLNVLRETEDGFRIAEEDLRLRGEGEILGTRQSGAAGHRIARPEFHAELMQAARDDARLVLETDPRLASSRGEALRLLLYLFERDQAIRLIEAG